MYNQLEIEKKWQTKWNEKRIFESDRKEGKEKFFGNFPFPYINGKLHMGHGYSMMKLESTIRFQRMMGKNTLWPFGFHATGEPIAGMAKRVAEGDESQIRALELSGIPKNQMDQFKDPYNIIRYFMKTTEETCRKLGVAVDWRRKFVTTQLTPTFSKFIEWQYRKLHSMGYVIQDSHPVIWCPSCKSPTGEHDRLEGDDARIVDFVLIKFYLPDIDAYLVPGTLRPETTFGVTNIFLHPEAEYVKANVDGDKLIFAKKVLPKFEDQEHQVTDIETVDVSSIFGKYAANPVTQSKVLILPATFIDPEGATGVVMSVPAHAPVDYATLVELQENPSLTEKYGIDHQKVKEIKPISLIKVEGFSEFPAKDVVEEMGIRGQDDPKLKEATKLVYRKEATHGITKEITGKYQGKPVEQIKEQLISDFVEEGIGFILKEPSEPVVCRCGTRNYVKFLEDQWFLKFSDKKWKAKVYKMIDQMTFYPPEAKNGFLRTVEWVENRACVRKSGLGTPAPWDPEWIIETLSDSVIYMAYYILSKYVNEGTFKEEWAVDEIFDYIYLGKGNAKSLAQKYGADEKLLREIKKDFQYWYGFELRSSGKDLVNNHLTFMLFHHAAIFPEKYWPKAVHVNGYVKVAKKTANNQIIEEKMSKRKGNFKTLDDLIDAYGADVTRLTMLTAGEGMEDASIMPEEIPSYSKWLVNLWSMATDTDVDEEMRHIDKWLISKMQSQIRETIDHYSNIRTRSAFQTAYHETMHLIKWYLNRRNGTKGPGYRYSVEVLVRMVAPMIPHLAEEIWNYWGNDGFISEAPFPTPDDSKVDEEAEHAEKYLGEVLDDLKGLISFLTSRNNPPPKKITLLVAPEWKYTIYEEARKNGIKTLLKNIMQDPEMKKRGKPAVSYAQSLMKRGAPPDIPMSFSMEMKTLEEAIPFLERQFEATVRVEPAEGNKHEKAKVAIPRRPGIILE